jgi:hypothetical protein
MLRPAPLGVLHNDAAPSIIDRPPFFDFVQGSKAAEAGIVIVEAALSHARGLSSAQISHSGF